MKEIKATAPTPQDWIELVRENESLKRKLDIAESALIGLKVFDEYESLCMENIGEQNK